MIPLYSYRYSGEPKTYYLLFRNSRLPLFYRFLKCGYGHCIVVVNDGINWYCINPGFNGMEIKILPFLATESIRKIFKADDWKRLKVVLKEPPAGFKMGFFTCVSVIKYFIGLRGCWTFTPYGLFKWLARLPRASYRRHNVLDVEIM